MRCSRPIMNFKLGNIEGRNCPVFYNGRGVLILDATGDNDADLGIGHSITCWNKVNGWPMGWADRLADGLHQGFVIYGPHEMSISGADFREIAADYLWEHE